MVKVSDWIGTAKTAAMSAYTTLDTAYKTNTRHGTPLGSHDMRYAEGKLIQALVELRLARYAQDSGYGASFLTNEGESHEEQTVLAVKRALDLAWPVIRH